MPINGVNGSADDERARLLGEIAAANERIDRASDVAAREAATRDALRAEVTATRDALAEVEHQHLQAVATLRDETAAEVERILAEAHRLAAEYEEATTIIR